MKRHRVGKPAKKRNYLVKVTRTLRDYVVIPVEAHTPREASKKAEEIAFVDENEGMDWQEGDPYVRMSSRIQK
jgi:hypothetical protein